MKSIFLLLLLVIIVPFVCSSKGKKELHRINIWTNTTDPLIDYQLSGVATNVGLYLLNVDTVRYIKTSDDGDYTRICVEKTVLKDVS